MVLSARDAAGVGRILALRPVGYGRGKLEAVKGLLASTSDGSFPGPWGVCNGPVRRCRRGIWPAGVGLGLRCQSHLDRLSHALVKPERAAGALPAVPAAVRLRPHLDDRSNSTASP